MSGIKLCIVIGNQEKDFIHISASKNTSKVHGIAQSKSCQYIHWWGRDICLAELYIFLIAESKYDLSHLSSECAEIRRCTQQLSQWDEDEAPPANPPVPLVCNLDRDRSYQESQERSCYSELAPTFLLWFRGVHNHQVEKSVYLFFSKICLHV